MPRGTGRRRKSLSIHSPNPHFRGAGGLTVRGSVTWLRAGAGAGAGLGQLVSSGPVRGPSPSRGLRASFSVARPPGGLRVWGLLWGSPHQHLLRLRDPLQWDTPVGGSSWAPAHTAPAPPQSCVSASRHSTPFPRWQGSGLSGGALWGRPITSLTSSGLHPPDCRGAGSSSQVESLSHLGGDLSPLTPPQGAGDRSQKKEVGALRPKPPPLGAPAQLPASPTEKTGCFRPCPPAPGRGTLPI